jgi:mRNA interferase MazF
MNPGDGVLAPLLQVLGGPIKRRPALFLAPLLGSYQTVLLCGISTQRHQIVANWDEVIQPGDADFASSGLQQTSVIRLSYLRGVTSPEIVGLIGRIDPARLARLRQRLSDHLRP